MIKKIGQGPKRVDRRGAKRTKLVNKIVEDSTVKRKSWDEHRDKVREIYGGPQGALLKTASIISGHVACGDRLLRERIFDLRGHRSILDIGSGAGQLAKPVLKYADPQAELTCCDLSFNMLRRARTRLKNSRPHYITADLVHLPFADASFDCITCGYVLEHLPDARMGLSEMARVLRNGGRMLLLVTEDNFSGAWTSRIWRCRTHNRRELQSACHALGLNWKRELWFSRWHELLRAGGICVEIEKR